jgi:hypothetical protein
MKASFLDHKCAVVVLHSVQDHFLFQPDHSHSDVFFKDLAHPNPAQKNNKRHPARPGETTCIGCTTHVEHRWSKLELFIFCNITELAPVQ